jgi:hypothetical protein
MTVLEPWETAEKGASAPRLLAGLDEPVAVLRLLSEPVLGSFRLQGSSDRVEVDEDGGPERLEGRFSSPEVTVLAPSVAVDEESEQPLDSRPGALEMVALGGIG